MRPRRATVARSSAPGLVSGAVALAAALALGATAVTRAAQAQEREPTRSKEHRYQIAIDTSWRERPIADAEAEAEAASLAPHASYEHRASGALLAINRMNYPNLLAWRKKTLPDYASEVEEGVRAAVEGYKRVNRKIHKVGIVPALDLEFRYRTKQREEVAFMRFLFFRRYTLSAVVSMPAKSGRKARRAHRALTASFEPYFPK